MKKSTSTWCMVKSHDIYLSDYLSIYLFICQSVYMLIYLSIYLSTDVSIFFTFYLYNGTVEWYGRDSLEILFDDDWSEIPLQKTLLNQRKRICCLNLNWWNNLNLILTLSNSWVALPSLVNTEMFIISYGYCQTKPGFKV